jgi:hypothetical protein
MRGRWRVAGDLLIAVATLVACASAPEAKPGVSNTAGRASVRTPNDVPWRVVRSLEPTPRATGPCGSVPTSSGPLADLARLELTAPATASVGEVVSVSAVITANSTTPRVITTPSTSAVLVVRDHRVVSRTQASAPQVPLQLSTGTARPAQVIPRSVRTIGCGGDAGTAGLTPGRYALVAVLGYQLDSVNAAPADGTVPPPTGERAFTLVSAPVSIVIG